MDDMGYRLQDGRNALQLPAAVVYAVLPHTPHAPELAKLARERGSEVLLHLPMEATSQNHLLGPGALRLNMNREEFLRTLDANLAAVPGVTGVNNHMGSLLTRYAGHMGWLMQALRERGLLFVDSRTTAGSVAGRVAAAASLPAASRDIFLDNIQDPDYVRARFAELVALAHRRGHALAIAHPHAVTIDVLAMELARLADHGVELVSLSELLARQAPALPAARAARQ